MPGIARFPDLIGSSVFITGGGSGIGAALTEGFIAQGARVAFVQRSDAGGLCDDIEARHGARPFFRRCDITDIDALGTVMAEVAEHQGPITVLVNNAANDQRRGIPETTVEEWDDAMAINLRPHFFTAQAAADGMRDAGGGAIINYSSIAYMMGLSGFPAYAAAKSAITGLTRALARELGPQNIRVNALMPGWVLTDRQLDLWATPEALAGHLARQCLPEHLVPQDMVGPTLFLASDAARMITGQALVVDGGVVSTG